MDALFNPHSNAAPSRHNIESDSDSDFSDPEAGRVGSSSSSITRSSKKELKKDQVEFKSAGHKEGCKCIVALNQAGQVWTGGLKNTSEGDGAVVVNQEVIGSGIAMDPDTFLLCLSTTHAPLSSLNRIASAILDTLKPSLVQVIDAYEPDLYLPEPSPDPPVRLLQSSSLPSSSHQPFEIPNLVTGLAAALAAQADRLDVPFQLFALPCARAGRPAGFYDPASAVNASEADPLALAALKMAPPVPAWQELGWTAKQASTFKRWAWLQKSEKERARRVRDQEDQMFM